MLVTDIAEFRKLMSEAQAAGYCAIDFETYGQKVRDDDEDLASEALILDRARANIVSFAYPHDGHVVHGAVVFDILRADIGLPGSQVMFAVKSLMEDPNVIKVCHNANYDVNVAINHKIKPNNVFCTMLAAALQDENRPKGLKIRAADVGMYLHNMANLEDIDEFVAYATEDAIATLRLYEAYRFGWITDHADCPVSPEDIKKLKLDSVARAFLYRQELPVLQIAIKAERRGIRINKQYLAEFEEFLKEEEQKIARDVLSHASAPFKLNSPKQLANFLYGDLGLKPSVFSPTTGAPSTGKEALLLLEDEHDAVRELLRLRLAQKLLSNYVNKKTGLPAFADADGFLHCTMNSHAAVTGRWSVQNPALQTIPRDDTISKYFGDKFSLREAFISRQDDWSLVDFDFSQIELRMLTIFCRDENLIDVYSHDCDIEGCPKDVKCTIGDVHSKTSELCGVDRQIAKNLNFGLCYGMGWKTLIKSLLKGGVRCDEKQAKRYHSAYHKAYPSIKEFHEQAWAEHQAKGYAEYITGKRRRVAELDSVDPKIEASGRRVLINNLIQGSSADLLKQALLRNEMDPRLKKMGVHFLLSIHDELMYEVHDRHAAEATVIIKENMEAIPENANREFCVPIKASGGYGKNWHNTKS